MGLYGGMDSKALGTVYHMRNWENDRGSIKLTFGLGREDRKKTRVAMFCYLGEAPYGSETQPDYVAIMKRIGYVPVEDSLSAVEASELIKLAIKEAEQIREKGGTMNYLEFAEKFIADRNGE